MSTVATPGGFDVSTYGKKSIVYHNASGKIVPNHLKSDPLISFFPDPIIIIDKNKFVIAWNSAMEALTGLGEGDMLGRTTDRYALRVYGVQRPVLAEFVISPNREIEIQFGIVRHGSIVQEDRVIRDGSSNVEKIVSVRAGPIHDRDGSMIGAIETLHDVTKYRCTEKIWRQSDEKYRQLIKTSMQFIVVLDLEGNITFADERALNIAGYSEDEYVKLNVKDMLPHDQIAIYRKLVARRKAGDKGIYCYCIDFVNSKGERIPLQVRSSLMNENDQPRGVLLTGLDMRDHHRTEEKLRQSEERFRAIFDTAQDYIFIKDCNLRYIEVNPQMERLVGIPAEKFIGRTDKELFGNEVSDHEKMIDFRVLKGEVVEEEQTRTSAGASTSFHIIKVPLRDSTGHITGICGISRNITKRKVMEETLRTSETKYRQLVENIRDVIFSVNLSGVVMYISPAIKPIIEYLPEEIVGRHFAEFVHPDDHERLLKSFDRIRSEILKDMGHEYRLITRYGDVRWVRFTYRSIYENDAIVGFSGTIFDVTERKVKENALCEREELYRTLTENVNYGVVLSINRKILFANGSFTAMMDCYNVKEIIGRDVHEFVRDDYQQKLKSLLNELETGHCVRSRFRGPCITKSGKEVWIDAHHNLIQWNGRLAVLATIRDISEDRVRILDMKQEAKNLKQENIRLRSFMKDRYRLDDIIGKSPAMQKVYEFIYRAAESDSPVIIHGESGTGKELVARAVHKMSARRDGAFVPVNCGAIPENLLESEFFGHKKGAFTGATVNKSGYLDVTDGGSLFLDEIGEVSLNMQVKLLRAIEGNGYFPLGSNEIKTTDFRIIAATNRRLIDLIKRGSMREDFFYRIHILPISVPPLRKRKDDIPLLVEYFLKKYGYDKGVHEIPSKVMEALYTYDWPGNVRELENVLNRYITFKQLDFIHIDSDPAGDRRHVSVDTLETSNEIENTDVMNAPGKDIILKVLHKNQWHRARAASELGISRNTLYRKMKQYGINHS